jgi:hypothetical protein
MAGRSRLAREALAQVGVHLGVHTWPFTVSVTVVVSPTLVAASSTPSSGTVEGQPWSTLITISGWSAEKNQNRPPPDPERRERIGFLT